MKNLEIYKVKELDDTSAKIVNGGGWIDWDAVFRAILAEMDDFVDGFKNGYNNGVF